MRCPILLVEDSEDDRDLFLRAVERSGWDLEVHWARSAEEALASLQAERFPGLRLMVVDLRLPSLSGMEFIGALASQPSTRSVPKVVFSTSGLESDIRAALEAGAQGFVQKPLDLQAHTQAVRTMLDFWIGLHRMPASQGKP